VESRPGAAFVCLMVWRCEPRRERKGILPLSYVPPNRLEAGVKLNRESDGQTFIKCEAILFDARLKTIPDIRK
jgi:hypothetical protein